MRFLIKWVVMLALAAAVGAGAFWWWTGQPLSLKAESLEFNVPPRASVRSAADQAVAGGVQANPTLLYWFFRLAGRSQPIKPGDYEVHSGMSPRDLLDKLLRGDRVMRSVTFVEGWTFRQLREALAKAPNLKPDSRDLTAAELMRTLGKSGVHPEGRFFPDTYQYAKNSSDLAVLRQSLQLMDQRLQAAWDARAADVPLKTRDEALILASIVEKETGRAQDRAEIAGVFHNRLRIGMPLQTDPTVIYGLGENFDGNLRKRDLTTDTPWNTYTRKGLPPTPIALPGKAALMAAVQPATTKALYFVARGDGSSAFSATLGEHNAAVRQYQLRGK